MTVAAEDDEVFQHLVAASAVAIVMSFEWAISSRAKLALIAGPDI